MLSCKALVAHSSELIDDQLGRRQRLSLHLHLALCQPCRRFVRQLRLSQALLRQLPPLQSTELDALATKLAELRRNHS